MIHEGGKETSDLLNRSFESVFTKETEFTQPKIVRWREMEVQEVNVEIEEIHQLIKKNTLEEMKAAGSDEVSGWILKEFREQLAKRMWDIIVCSLMKEVPKE